MPAKIVNEKLLNRKLFRKLKVETQILVNMKGKESVCGIEILFPERGPLSKLTEKQVEPLRKQLERTPHDGWQRVTA